MPHFPMVFAFAEGACLEQTTCPVRLSGRPRQGFTTYRLSQHAGTYPAMSTDSHLSNAAHNVLYFPIK